MGRKDDCWIQYAHLFRRDEYECTACGFFADKPYITCPNCGRTIKGVKYKASWVDEIEGIDVTIEG